ncbi:cyanophycinase [Deinobacterium chartae]|uniref:Cyanophycinase n=1 Tax=Deinobacterium chartae TaxID=521158 RepID=A0A841HXK4_9DEIO|nr:cyanophycinase [Deinobacterium chartae]MBB6097384.1 cyanophycinase [Deinobacterium chartae]
MPEKNEHLAEGNGTLIIIGGHESKEGHKTILGEIARRTQGKRLVIATVASHQPEGYFEKYQEVFGELGVTDLVELYVKDRSEAHLEEKIAAFDNAAGVFFTGGDQLRITSQLGDTPIYSRIFEIYRNGGLVCGTSAGASAMCETMLVGGSGDESHRIGDLQMAPGLGLVRNAVIDQHFAERGRMGRLLGAVAKNPRNLGIGIDEDTAIVLDDHRDFRVIGNGAVYVIDGRDISCSNVAEASSDSVLSIYDVHLHVLSEGDGFDLTTRRPTPARRLERAQGD